MTTNKKWTDEAVATLQSIVGTENPVSAATVEAAAAKLDVSAKSVAAKLRHLDIAVASMAAVKTSAFSEDETTDLATFLRQNDGQFTYKEVAERFASGKFTAKQIQGKVLALELTATVKASEKVEYQRSYTEAEEAKFVSMANSGSFIEEIAAALGKEVSSVRGKALSLNKNGLIAKIPAQKESTAKSDVDAFDALGDVAGLTVAEIAAKLEKSERGVKTLLTRRGVDVKDYKGAAKRAKADSKVAAA